MITKETLSFDAFKSGKQEGLELAIAILIDLRNDPIIDGKQAHEILQIAIDTLGEYGK